MATRSGAGTVWYVDASAPAGGNGVSWSAPLRYVQDALSVAAAGDDIHIGRGTYKPDQADNGGATPGDRAATFALQYGVTLRGGYAGYGAANPEVRDLGAYETILSGDLNGDDGVNFTNTADNSFHVLVGRASVAIAMLDGLTVRGGNGSDAGDPNYPNAGGGLLLVGANPTVFNCTFVANSAVGAGGAVLIGSGDPTFLGCTFSGNRAGTGGAAECRDGATAIFDDCQFSGNAATDGGAMRLVGAGSAVLDRCKFNANVATGFGGGIYVRNGGSPLVSWCTFRGNTATSGGALAIRNASALATGCEFSDNIAVRSGGAVITAQHASAGLTACSFVGNRANSGGGLYTSDDSSPNLVNCTFEQNVAPVKGGGLCAAGTSAFVVTGCTFTANSANWGGGMSSGGGTPMLTDCTFSANSASYGGGCYSGGAGMPFIQGGTWQENSAYDGGGLFNEAGASPTISEVAFQGNSAAHAGGAVYTTGECYVGVLSCVFRENSAVGQGGALCGLAGSWLVVMDTRLVANVCHVAGGAFYLATGASADLVNARLIGNSAETTGGGMNLASAGRCTATNCLFDGNIANSADGGALRSEANCTAHFYDCTIVANRAATVGGFSSHGGDLELFNTILWGNVDDSGQGEAAQIFAGGAPLTVHYCDIQGWSGDLGGAGNFGLNPQFVAPAGPDGIAGTEDDDLRLGAGSACTDAGDNGAVPADIFDLNHNGDTSEPLPFDLAGDSRFIDDPSVPDTGAGTPPLVDIGTFEHQVTWRLGDLNCDGLVNFDDINPFVLAMTNPNTYALEHPACPLGLADCNGDGQVDEGDVDAFVALLGG